MNLIKLLTPNNLCEEKEKFFEGTKYIPKFKYNWDNEQINDWLEINPHYHKLFNSLRAQNYSSIVSEASKLFSVQIDEVCLSKASAKITSKPKPLQSPPIQRIVETFEKAFQYFGLNEYCIEVVDQPGFNFRPEPSKKRIVMIKHASLEFFSIEGEVRHELVHIIRHENGLCNSIDPSENYLPTEEGLAAYFQDYSSEIDQLSLFQHAAEYVATPIALQGSLRDVVNFFMSIGFSQELAWQRGVRHKFGWIDTSQTGDIMKPSMYFHYEQKIKALQPEQRLRLLVAKVSLDELSNYPRYFGRFPIKLLEDFFSQ